MYNQIAPETLAKNEPVPFDGSEEYMFADIDADTRTPPFVMTMNPSVNKPAKYVAPVTKLEDDEDDEDDDEDLPGPVESENPTYGSLDVIAVKQFQQSKMEPLSQFYVGSLTVVGLYILYRYLRK
jgi:hypothetical protein